MNCFLNMGIKPLSLSKKINTKQAIGTEINEWKMMTCPSSTANIRLTSAQ